MQIQFTVNPSIITTLLKSKVIGKMFAYCLFLCLKERPLDRLYRSSHHEAFCWKGVLRNFAKFTGKQLYQSLLFNKVAGLRSVNLLKKRLCHRCFPVIFAKFLRTPLFTEHLRRLLLPLPKTKFRIFQTQEKA